MKVVAATCSEFYWLSRRAGCALATDFTAIKAVDRFGAIRGMVGYQDWMPNSVKLHMAADTPIVWRSLLRPALSYPFLEVGVGLCVGIIPDHKHKSLDFVRAVGFREGYRQPNGWAKGVDVVVMELRREDCRWLSPERMVA